MARGTRRRASSRRSAIELRTVMSSNYATNEAWFARPHFGATGAIAAPPVGRDRLDRRATRQARLGEDGRDVRREAALERLRRHENVVAHAVFVQGRAFDDEGLRIRALQ